MIERDYFFLYLAIAIITTFLFGIILGANMYKASLENGSKVVVPYVYNNIGEPVQWKVISADQQ